ncbi:hypothetical protein [Fluviicola taffensis]|uniref:Uncharacterized protein n=1 Tax=Fluviicola taffensis (strain DSM 16823 / NCIMB 13979 / RW262) TaxID=755732 RepID=F2IC43_FLUTR|nr:hypothetical protein [Fluviicola taffensis]AEA43269.1 hypothetical protein Fluta_1274 [Fluviicola taffensis DSM 16823]
MSIFRKHKWGLIQLGVSILVVVGWLKKPIDEGQAGKDSYFLIFILGIIVTIYSIRAYWDSELKKNEKRIPFFIIILTISGISIGSAIIKSIDKKRKPLIIATNGYNERIILYKDNTYVFKHHEAEWTHYDRGTYRRLKNKFQLDKKIFVSITKTRDFYISGDSLYVLSKYPTDTIVFKKGHPKFHFRTKVISE